MKTTIEKAQHTPGPWRIVRDEDGCFEIADENGLLINKTVARGGTTNRANARLIAAAPDLLEACESALIALTNPGSENWRQTALTDIRAAIAKAEGRQP